MPSWKVSACPLDAYAIKGRQIMVLVYAIMIGNASVVYFLEKKDGGHGSEAKSTVHRAES